jgi:hypothetical protein
MLTQYAQTLALTRLNILSSLIWAIKDVRRLTARKPGV